MNEVSHLLERIRQGEPSAAALAKLARHDALKARLVELRYFAGLTGDQAAQALGISPKTADRYWVYARAWLRREMDGHEAH
jgi:DNA-directed RNA polymerase specialized sigma24 family protein